jgi:hypothetical protein
VDDFSEVWQSTDEEYCVILWKQARQKLVQMRDRGGSEETGGILVGFYSDDLTTAIVTQATEPPSDSLRGATWFHRGVAGLRKMLSGLWEKPNRLDHLGEWHDHTAPHIRLSERDIREMKDISGSSRYQCSEPILIVIGRQGSGGRVPCRVFVFPSGEMKELLDKMPFR